MNLDPAWLTWVVLIAPMAFSFIVGGGYFGYCMAKSSGPIEAAEKFKVFTWAISPLWLSALALFVAFALIGDDLEGVFGRPWSSLLESPLWLVAAIGTGGVMAAIAILGAWTAVRSAEDRETTAAFLAWEWRELPSLVILAPLAEELIFRGFGLYALSDWPLWASALITSIAFALMHYRPVAIANAFAAGLALFALYVASGSLWIPIIAHALANLITWIWMRTTHQRITGGR